MTLFEKIIETNLINFLIVISTLVLIFKKAHLGNFINKLADDIKNNVEKSEKDTLKSIQNYNNAKNLIKDTPKLKEEIMQKAKNLLDCEVEKLKTHTKKKKEDIENFARDKKIVDGEKYKTKTTREIYLASINLAKDEIMTLLDGKKGKEFHKKIIDLAIDELDEIKIGGQNE